MKSEYQITVHSTLRFIIFFSICFNSAILLIIDDLPHEPKYITFLVTTIVLLISVYLSHLVSMAKVRVILSEQGFRHIWDRKFLLSWEKDITIPWGEIVNYVYEEDRTFDSFIIRLTNNRRYKVQRINILPIKDDFKKLYKDFPALSNKYKKMIDPNGISKDIVEGASIYSNKYFRWVFYAFVALFVLLVINKIFNPGTSTPWSALALIGSAILFYKFMIINKS